MNRTDFDPRLDPPGTGTVDTGSLEGVTAAGWDAGINVHLRPIPFLVQAFLADLEQNPSSAILSPGPIRTPMIDGGNISSQR
jgi:hypothetical protein